ncbi:MAG: hypothetical protein KJ749_15205 [Planctomycetes bacterium]|nr:hypothetical protein [Planctomycetota bacterium]
MPPEDDGNPEPAAQSDSLPTENTPPIEDAYEPAAGTGEPVPEDEPDLFGAAARALEIEPAEGPGSDELGGGTPGGPPSSIESGMDEADDAASIPDDLAANAREGASHVARDWGCENSAHSIAVELKRIEIEVRELLEGRDVRRKRKLSGSRRWRELEDDIITWRYSGRFDEDTLARLRCMIARRDHLFTRLRFLAGTRPVWNS